VLAGLGVVAGHEDLAVLLLHVAVPDLAVDLRDDPRRAPSVAARVAIRERPAVPSAR